MEEIWAGGDDPGQELALDRSDLKCYSPIVLVKQELR